MPFTAVVSARSLFRCLVSVALVCSAASGARAPAVPGYIGAATCALCHQAEAAEQDRSAHTHALAPASARLSLFAGNTDLFRPPRYHFRFLTDARGLRVAISDSSGSLEFPLDWAFGAGKQATTFVGRIDADRYLEHYFSYYSAIRSLAATPGQIGFPSNTLELASGLTYPTLDPVIGIVKCFECHSTGHPIIAPGNVITPVELGVRCEACHGAGASHIDGLRRGQTAAAKTLPVNLVRLSGPRLNQICGKCHRTLDPKSDFDWDKPWNVRQQPVYLSRSTCFLRSGGKLSCLTCHSPHGPLETNSSAYDAKCISCHSHLKHPAVDGRVGSACVTCHMPGVPVQENLVFTNHWIGIYSSASKTRPIR